MKRFFVLLLAIAVVGLFTPSAFGVNNGHWTQGTTGCLPDLNVQAAPPPAGNGVCDPTNTPNIWQLEFPVQNCPVPPGFTKYLNWRCEYDPGIAVTPPSCPCNYDGEGTVYGAVIDQNGSPLDGVKVEGYGGKSATSAGGGLFTMHHQAGWFTITASKAGYGSQAKGSVPIADASFTALYIVLNP